jgi:hypothetical protein
VSHVAVDVSLNFILSAPHCYLFPSPQSRGRTIRSQRQKTA